MNDEHARHDALNAIAAGKAHAQLVERRLRRGTARREDVTEALRNICVAFDRVTVFCETVNSPHAAPEHADEEPRVQSILISRKSK